MAKKTAPKAPATKPAPTTGNASAETAGEEVNKSRLIQDILAVSPDRGPKDIADELTSMGVPTTPKYVSTIKTNMKTKAGLPKRKIRSSSRVAKTPQAASETELNFEHLKMAKEMARQLGGVKEAKQVLNALMHLTE